MDFTMRVEEFTPRTWDDEGLLYENLPDTSKRLVEDLAVSVLSGNGKAIVFGHHSVGKTYLIEQFVSNINRFTQRLRNPNPPVFLDITQNVWKSIEGIPGNFETPAGLDAFVQAITANYQRPISEFCFVTEMPNVAEVISISYPKAKVILEASLPTFMLILRAESQGVSKIWSKWGKIDANELCLTKVELVTALHYSLRGEFNEESALNISKKEITALISYFIRRDPSLKSTEGSSKGKILLPPGLWVMALKRYIGLKVFARERFLTKNGSFNVGAAVKLVFEEMGKEFSEVVTPQFDKIVIEARVEDLHHFPKEFVEALGISMQDESGSNESNPNADVDSSYSDMSTLYQRLSGKVFGQDSAVRSVSDAMLIPAAGLNDKTKPLRSFLFLGPTGVGKTKLALTLAEEVGNLPMNVVRLDMSEYSRDHEVAKLFGSPPGYVGHSEGGLLTNEVKKNPRSLVLLDEIEKAHPKVFDQFLQVLDAGRMTTGSGEVVDFTNTIIVMTSNLGAKELTKQDLGFSALSRVDTEVDRKHRSEGIITKEVEKNFKPEFINRIDEKVVFNELSRETIESIIGEEFDILRGRIGDRASLSSLPPEVVAWILDHSETLKYGAREVQRVISRNVSSQIAKFLLKNESNSKSVSLAIHEDEILVRGV